MALDEVLKEMMQGPVGAVAFIEFAWYTAKLLCVMGPGSPDHPNYGTHGYKIFERLVLLPLPLDALYLGYEVAKRLLSKKAPEQTPTEPPMRPLM